MGERHAVIDSRCYNEIFQAKFQNANISEFMPIISLNDHI